MQRMIVLLWCAKIPEIIWMNKVAVKASDFYSLSLKAAALRLVLSLLWTPLAETPNSSSEEKKLTGGTC